MACENLYGDSGDWLIKTSNTKPRAKGILTIGAVLLLAMTAIGCGGGGSGHSTGKARVKKSNTIHKKQLRKEDSTPVYSGSVSISWYPPATNADGSSLTDLGGFIVYYGKSDDVRYNYSINVGSATTASIGKLSPGSWCFAVTAYDLSGSESDYSNDACTTI